MVPENQMWNYNFIGLSLVQNLKFGLILENPKEFYNEIHRVSHFIRFNKGDEEEDAETIDKDDFY
jgi:pre-mRNA-processing factor 8